MKQPFALKKFIDSYNTQMALQIRWLWIMFTIETASEWEKKINNNKKKWYMLERKHKII